MFSSFKKLPILSAILSTVLISAAMATPLQVSPVSVDLTAPAQTASINLKNTGDTPVNVQSRVFAWSQSGGEDQYVPAKDVVASPPAAILQPGATYTIRIARTAASVKSGEQSYRLVVDQLPDVNVRRPNTTVNMAIRYSIPVFFSDKSAGTDLVWNVRREGKKLIAEVTNNGDRHAKIAGLEATAAGAKVSFGGGLNGYVLPGSTMRWTASAQSIGSGTSVKITAKGDDYAIDQTVVVKP